MWSWHNHFPLLPTRVLVASSVLSRKHIEDVHYRQRLKPHSFYGLYVRAEALTHKEEM